MITTCPECGKEFDVLYPDLWRYRRGNFLCSYGCMRKYDKRKEESGDMSRLRKDGSPAQRPGPKPKKQIIEIPEQVPTVKLTGPLNIETPEPEKVTVEVPEKIVVPVTYDGMVIREVEGNFGRYRRSDVGAAVYIDFESADGMDVLSFTIDQWRSFRSEQNKAAAILGVEL